VSPPPEDNSDETIFKEDNCDSDASTLQDYFREQAIHFTQRLEEMNNGLLDTQENLHELTGNDLSREASFRAYTNCSVLNLQLFPLINKYFPPFSEVGSLKQ
jgi:hypothetical protein